MKSDDRTVETEAQHNDEVLYAIIVHGMVPEFMPCVAFRREKHFKSAGKKIIKCPYCCGVLRVVDKNAKLELMRYPRNAKPAVPIKKSMQCGKCRNTIGILHVAA